MPHVSRFAALAAGLLALLGAAAAQTPKKRDLVIWGIAVGLIAVAGHLPGSAGRSARRLLGRIAPAAARKLVLSVVGVSLMSGLAVGGTATASASATVEHSNGQRADTARPAEIAPDTVASWTSVEGSAVQLASSSGPTVAPAINLDWPSTTAPIDIDWPAPPGITGSSSASPEKTVDVDWPKATGPVVVLRGDSLWSIAAAHLPANASSADIDHSWHRWYAANRAVIGADPNLILPGQILLPPTQPNGE